MVIPSLIAVEQSLSGLGRVVASSQASVAVFLHGKLDAATNATFGFTEMENTEI